MDENLLTLSNQSLELALEIFALKKRIDRNNGAYILFDSVASDAAFIQDCWGDILISNDERKMVLAFRGAYQAMASIKYYLEIIEKSESLPKLIIRPLRVKSQNIKLSLKPYVEQYDGMYEEEIDDELYNAVSELFDKYIDNDDIIEE